MKVVVLTGAGISAESGISTFRDAGGLWDKFSIMDVCSIVGFYNNPQLVLDFHNERRKEYQDKEPNAAHLALAKWEQEPGWDVHIITQNVDTLHEKAGSKKVYHMHGSFFESMCQNCGTIEPLMADITQQDKCKSCGKVGEIRPNVVWFGENIHHSAEIENLLSTADVYLSIGTSSNVYPAAGFVSTARENNALCIEANVEQTSMSNRYHVITTGPASQTVPKLVEEFCKNKL